MNIFGFFVREKKKKRIFSDYQQESVNRFGREQFRRLIKRGLNVPVALL